MTECMLLDIFVQDQYYEKYKGLYSAPSEATTMIFNNECVGANSLAQLCSSAQLLC